MSSRKRAKQSQHNASTVYSPVRDHEEESTHNFSSAYSYNHNLVELAISDKNVNLLMDDADASSLSSLFSDSLDQDDDHIQYALSNTPTQKQYAQALKQIMEQEIEEPEFGVMMDKIIRMLIHLSNESDDVTDIASQIRHLQKWSPQDALTNIISNEEKLASDFTDSFIEKQENAAMKIMLQIVIKILNMRKLITDYPMIFVPISFKEYQPRFMTKKSERKHKIEKTRKLKERRRSSVLSNVSNQKFVNTQRHSVISNGINEEEEQSILSDLSREHNTDLTDTHINNQIQSEQTKFVADSDENKINKTHSLPMQTSPHRGSLSQKRAHKHSKTPSKVRFEKMRSGLSLVLLPLPKQPSITRVRSGGHVQDQSIVFKKRISNASQQQMGLLRSSMKSPSVTDIKEENTSSDFDLRSNNSVNVKHMFQSTININAKPSNPLSPSMKQKSNKDNKTKECNKKLREWAKAFVFNHDDTFITPDQFMEFKHKIICEGCQTEIKLKDCINKLKKYEAGENDKFKKTFLFHDLYCETLRKYKEAIRQYAFESEFRERYHTLPCDLKDPDRYLHLFALKDYLLVVDSPLSRNAKIEDKKPHKPRLNTHKISHKSKVNTHMNNVHSQSQSNMSSAHSNFYVDTTDAGLRRERRLALLNLYREAISKASMPPQGIELSIQRTIQQLDEVNSELPEILRYIDVTTFGRPLWYFCVDQLSTKDRLPLWNILEFLATELPTSMAINLLRSTRDALVRFQVQPLDKVCLKIIAASKYPIATALYLAAFMQSNALRDSSRATDFNGISNKYIDIGTDLLSQIESDHLLAILIEIPSNINDLSILDIVVRFKLEAFLEFHRLQPIFMNMWTEYQYLDPSKPFRNREADSIDILDLCWHNSALFYYAPVGAFTLQCTTYIFHVALVSYVTAQLLYPYKPIIAIEWIVWIFNAGFVLYEISELTIRRLGYFQYYNNLVGFIISINWIILAILRFTIYYHLLARYYCDIESFEEQCISEGFELFIAEMCPTQIHSNAFDHICFRNAPLTKLYMIFWSIQVVLLWCRIAALLQRNKHAGPLLRMIMNMMVEISSFALLLFLFVFGFVLAVFYIAGGDVDEDGGFGGLNRLSSVFLYHIQALLAAQEWGEIVSESEEGFDSDRSIMVETCMVLLTIFGTVLLMNLFIALMTITYERGKRNARVKTNFARITHTIELDQKSAVMPPPLNILVFALTILYWFFDVLLMLCTCGYWTVKLQQLYPIKYSLKEELQCKEKESKHKRMGSIGYGTMTLEPSGGFSHETQKQMSVNSENSEAGFFELSKDVSMPTPNAQYMMDNVHCGCFVRLSREGKQKNTSCGRCKNLMAICCGNIDKNESYSNNVHVLGHKYCRHCRHSLSDKGNIDRYFELFKYWQLLDEDDKTLLRLRLSGSNICPHCFRSYTYSHGKKVKHGLNRFEVMLEVMSYYVFKILIWWWLLFILAIPALIKYVYKRLNHNYSEQNSNFNTQMITNAYENDSETKAKVDRVIKKYNNNGDSAYGSGNGFNKQKAIVSLENNKSVNMVQTQSMDAIDKEEKLFLVNVPKSSNDLREDKLSKIETQINDLRELIIMQQMQTQKNTNAKKVSFNTEIIGDNHANVVLKDRKIGHKHRETQPAMDTLINNELFPLRDQLSENVISEDRESEYSDDTSHHFDNDSMTTPRVVSHARSEATKIHETGINDLYFLKKKSTDSTWL